MISRASGIRARTINLRDDLIQQIDALVDCRRELGEPRLRRNAVIEEGMVLILQKYRDDGVVCVPDGEPDRAA